MADRFAEVAARADPLRRGLISHGYRMLGSVREAEALAHQTLTSTTARYGGPAGPGLRSELYTAATRDCLARAPSTRPLPTAFGEPTEPEGELPKRPEVTWLEPIPDELAEGRIGLGFVAALQHLPPRQRAALILRDVEGWSSGEVAAVLDTGPAEVNELLTEAWERFTPERSSHAVPDQDALLARYARAFELYDVPAIVELFDPDAVWEMPPFTSWFRGARTIGRLITTHCPAEAAGDQVMVPVRANGQPGFAVYMRDPVENVHRAFQIQVLTLTVTGIVHAVAFFDLTLFDAFSLPELLSGLPEQDADRRWRPHVERRRENHSHG